MLQTQTLEPRIESSLLWLEDGRQHFVHESYRDFFLGRYFARTGDIFLSCLLESKEEDLIESHRILRSFRSLFDGLTIFMRGNFIKNKDVLRFFGGLLGDVEAFDYVKRLIGDHFEYKPQYEVILPNLNVEAAVNVVQDRPDGDKSRDYVINELIGVLKRERQIDCDDKLGSVSYLARLGYSRTVDELIDWLLSDHPKRHWAIPVLGDLGNEKAVLPLLDYVRKPENIARFWIPSALRKILGYGSVPFLVDYVHSEEIPIWYAALEQLVYVKDFNFHNLGFRLYALRNPKKGSDLNSLFFYSLHDPFRIPDITDRLLLPFKKEVLNQDISH